MSHPEQEMTDRREANKRLIAATERGDIGEVAQLLVEGAFVDSVGKGKKTPLIVAAESGKEEIVSALLEAGANVSRVDSTGMTALMAAAHGGFAGVVESLAEAGCDVNKESRRFGSALLLASAKGHEEVVRILLRHGAIEIADSSQRTPLSVACSAGCARVVSALLDAHADKEHARQNGRRPIHDAVQSRSKECVELLVRAGARLTCSDNSGISPLSLACIEGNFEIVKLLLYAEAPIDWEDAKGWTPLIHAAEHGRLEIVKLLLRSGASPDIVAHNGFTALTTARMRHHDEVCEVLERGVARATPAQVEVMTLAAAAIPRIGEQSPASLLVSDPHLLRWFAGLLHRHPTVERLAEAVEDGGAWPFERLVGEDHGPELVNLVKAGLIDVWAYAIRRHRSNSKVCLRILEAAVRHIDAILPQLEEVMLEAELAEAVVELLRAQKQNSAVSGMSLRLIWKMALHCKRTAERIADIGGLEATVEAMKIHMDSSALVDDASGVFTNVSMYTSTQDRVVSSGALTAMMEGMRTHAHWSLQSGGCSLMWNLSLLSVERKKTIIELGGLAAILHALDEHHEQTAQERGAGAICHLLATSELYQKYATPEVIAAVCAAAEHSFSKVTALMLETITRTEHPAVRSARENGTCTLVFAPRCKKPCGTPAAFCPECSIQQTLYMCRTCELSEGFSRCCEICFAKFHSGHRGIALFIPGTCDQVNMGKST